MKPLEEIYTLLGPLPGMRLWQARLLDHLIDKYGISSALELGTSHGVGSAYLCNSLSRYPGAGLDSVDFYEAGQLEPNAHDLVGRVGAACSYTWIPQECGYTWWLADEIGGGATPRYQLVYLDGAHALDPDGLAFFLADRLLRPGGWFVFDDLPWTYDASPSLKDTEAVKAMRYRARTTPQVGLLWERIVTTHPAYGNFKVEQSMGFAQKKPSVARP